MSENDIEIGKVLGSNSQIDYICEVFNDSDVESVPSPSDHRFGQFVSVTKEVDENEIVFVGVIYDSRIVDPEQGRDGPRLSRPEEQNLFHPSYVDEKKKLLGIALIGYIDPEKKKHHCVPPWTLEVDDIVKKMTDDEMVEFHEREGEVRIGYYQGLLRIAQPLASDLLSNIIGKLKAERPEDRKALNVIERNLEFKKMMKEV